MMFSKSPFIGEASETGLVCKFKQKVTQHILIKLVLDSSNVLPEGQIGSYRYLF